MATIPADSDLLYELHHSLDAMVLPVAGRVLKMACFEVARKHFEWDMLNDIGVINLLRKDYLRHGSFKRTFILYQGTRLDSRSHRYESLLALLVVTMVGSVVAGVILENYKDNKGRIATWVRKLRDEARLFGIKGGNRNIFRVVYERRRRIRLLNKFCSSSAEKLLADFRVLTNCYVARRMHDAGLISYGEYGELVSRFLAKQKRGDQDPLVHKFLTFLKTYASEGAHIDPDKVLLACCAYGKGTVAQDLDKVGAKLRLPQNTDVANVFHGLPAAPGAAAGISHVLGRRRKPTSHCVILVADSNRFSPDDFHSLESSAGAVTTNTGVTGHIPVICRGMSKACVILCFEDFKQIRNGDRIALSGTTGTVAVGVVVALH